MVVPPPSPQGLVVPASNRVVVARVRLFCGEGCRSPGPPPATYPDLPDVPGNTPAWSRMPGRRPGWRPWISRKKTACRKKTVRRSPFFLRQAAILRGSCRVTRGPFRGRLAIQARDRAMRACWRGLKIADPRVLLSVLYCPRSSARPCRCPVCAVMCHAAGTGRVSTPGVTNYRTRVAVTPAPRIWRIYPQTPTFLAPDRGFCSRAPPQRATSLRRSRHPCGNHPHPTVWLLATTR